MTSQGPLSQTPSPPRQVHSPSQYSHNDRGAALRSSGKSLVDFNMPLHAQPVPPIARQAMQNAFEDLKGAISPQYSKNFDDSTLQRVRKEALDIENQLGSRGWLRNMRRLQPLLTALEHYSNVMGTLCNGTPFLPWIWAPITLILRISSEHIESFDLIIGAYSKIASALSRFEMLDKAIGRDIRLSETLAAYYAEILGFHKHAYKFLQRSGQSFYYSAVVYEKKTSPDHPV